MDILNLHERRTEVKKIKGQDCNYGNEAERQIRTGLTTLQTCEERRKSYRQVASLNFETCYYILTKPDLKDHGSSTNLGHSEQL
jgi:hypothetical protein